MSAGTIIALGERFEVADVWEGLDQLEYYGVPFDSVKVAFENDRDAIVFGCGLIGRSGSSNIRAGQLVVRNVFERFGLSTGTDSDDAIC